MDDEEDGGGNLFLLKARLCVHGNRDDEKGSLRTDAAVVSHNAFRLLYSTAVCAGMILGKAYIRGACTQSGVRQSDLYVRTSGEMNLRGEMWLLPAIKYGIGSACRKWQRESEVLRSALWGAPQLLIRDDSDQHDHRNQECRCSGLLLVVAKYVDDLEVREIELLKFSVHRRK